MWIMIVLSLKIKTDPLFNEILVKFPYLVGMIADQNFYVLHFLILRLRLRPMAEGQSLPGPNIWLRLSENCAYGPTLANPGKTVETTELAA